jgi:hypothetical protein
MLRDYHVAQHHYYSVRSSSVTNKTLIARERDRPDVARRRA